MVSTGSRSWNPDALSGTRLGSCVLEDPLSISNMGAVFLARQERPSRYVAVKVIHRELASYPEDWQLSLTRFQREADATAALDHANIVPIYEFGETGDLAYLVMPYFPDGSLATRLEQQGPLPVRQTVQYIEQLALALDYAHARGIIHRDVKPSNMLLHPDGRVLLADFGIARPLLVPEPTSESTPESAGIGNAISLTQAGTAMGTPEYMAPEQVRAGELTPATDQYGLGIATYELLGGQTPFVAGDVSTVLSRQLTSPPPSLRTLRSEIPARVEEVIHWALAKDPADRPASASQFAKALRAALENVPWEGGKIGGAGRSLQGASALSLVTAAVGQEGGNYQRLFPDLTLPLSQSARPHVSAEPEFAVDEAYADQSTITVGPGGIRIQEVPNRPGGVGEYATTYAPGGPLWPLPLKGPDKRTALAAVAGLVMAIVALIIMASLIVHSMQSALSSPSSAPNGVVSSSPSPHSQQAAAAALSTTTPAPPNVNPVTPTVNPVTPTASAVASTGGLVVAPTQVTFACHSTQSVTLQLTNTGAEAVSWAAQDSSSHLSAVIVQPPSGTLPAGATEAITLSIASGTLTSSQGTIQFVVVSGQQVGNPTQVTYVIPTCD